MSINSRYVIRSAAFTLIEVLVVVALIGILAAIVLVNLSDARESSRVAKAQTELKTIETALKLYRETTGVMPVPNPGGGPLDLCTICDWSQANPNQTGIARWETSVVPEVASRTSARLPARDPWGRHYAYDNNFRLPVANGGDQPSIVCSVGPDGVLNTWASPGASDCEREAQGDDVCIFMEESDDAAPVC